MTIWGSARPRVFGVECGVKGDKKRPMLVLAGNGHVHANLGIPSRVDRRLEGGVGVTIIPSSSRQAKHSLRENAADWLWVVRR